MRISSGNASKIMAKKWSDYSNGIPTEDQKNIFVSGAVLMFTTITSTAAIQITTFARIH